MTPLVRWTLVAMLHLLVTHPAFAPNPRNVPRLRELVIVAVVVADAAEADPLADLEVKGTAALLVAIGFYESGYAIGARGDLGEVGVWQLRPPPLGDPVPKTLRGQARETIRRWRVLGPAGFTGERSCPCPLAETRIRKARELLDLTDGT